MSLTHVVINTCDDHAKREMLITNTCDDRVKRKMYQVERSPTVN